MVASAQLAQRIEIALRSAFLMTADLAEVLTDWPNMEDWERASWSLEWDQFMASDLPLLDRHYCAGNMTADQQARYRKLLDHLREALPVIVRLDLYRPPVPLDI